MVWSFGFRSPSPWVFLRVRPWIDSLSRKLVPDGVRVTASYTTRRTRAILSRSTTTTPSSRE